MIPSSQSLGSFAYVAARSAEEYVAWLGRVHEARLQDLAVWLRDRGGPLEEMDATAASLVTLWEWAVGEIRAGVPGIAADARPSTAVFLRSTAGAESFREEAAAEPVAHYIFEVLRREFPTARWGLHPVSKPNISSYQEPVVVLPGRRCVRATNIVQTGAHAAAQGKPRVFQPNWLLEQMEYSGWLRPVGEMRGSSVLAPLLGLPRVGVGDPVRRVPLAVAPDVVDDGSWSASDVGAVLAIGPGEGDDLLECPPLDEELVAERLTAGGWRTQSGGPVTASVVGTDGAVLVWGNEQVLLEVNAADGRARFLKLDIVRVTDAEWAGVLAGLEDLAARLGGYLGIPGERE